MSLTARSLNGDTCFLLTFAPLDASASSPGSFTILIDPWLTGPITVISPLLVYSERKATPSISSLKELDQPPDVVLISLTQPDHCNEETLRQLPPEWPTKILAIPAAAREIRSWKHFQPERIQNLPKYSKEDRSSLHYITIPASSSNGADGEVTIAWLPARLDLTGLHNAIGITYRAPSNDTPPTSDRQPTCQKISPTSSSSPDIPTETTLSVLYSPHGPSHDIIHDYASSHLNESGALPLTALLHSMNTVTNPWYFGGIVVAGTPGGAKLARSLNARVWISAHDAEKVNTGLTVAQSRYEKYSTEEIERMLKKGDEGEGKGKEVPVQTEVVRLGPGEAYTVRGV